MSYHNNTNNIRSLPSPPPVSMNRLSLDGRSVASGSRPLSVISTPSFSVVAPAYDNPALRGSAAESSTNAIHTYNARVGGTMVDMIIRISTPKDSHDSTLTLSCQAGGVERIIGETRTVRVSSPSQAEFDIYFIPRESIPLNALFKFRVWLSSRELQIRLWAEDEFWIGAQLPFPAIPGAHLARLMHTSTLFHVYHGTAGAALLVYTVSIDPVPYALTHDEYSVSLRYESGGISSELCSNLRVRLSCDIKDISFIIYSIRQESEPRGSRHKFRLWIRSAVGGICQRLWAEDDIWIGKGLRFESVQQGNVILANRGASGLATPRPDTFSDAPELPAYSAAPHANEFQ